MKRKKDWFVAIAMSFGMVGAAHSAGYLKLGDIKGEAAPQSPAASGDVAPKPAEPQKGLLLPAVQKASDVTPDTPPPAPRSKPRVATGDINGDGQDAAIKRATMTVRKAGDKPVEHGARAQDSARGQHFKRAVLTPRKQGGDGN